MIRLKLVIFNDMTDKEPLRAGIIKSLGLAFGDIETRPIYTLSVVFQLTQPTPERIFGVLSLIVWTPVVLVSLEYAWPSREPWP